MHIVDEIEIKQNLIITARERGKIVARREGHNIWLNVGREYLAQLISYRSFGPDVPYINERIKYMGVGVGGTRQLALMQSANIAPIVPDYAGTNIQTDTDPTITTIERPVRISGGTGAPAAGDVWVGVIGSSDPFPALPAFGEVTHRRIFGPLEVSYAPYLSVPLSEIGLYTAAANPELSNNKAVAYDTFDTLSKTVAISIEAVWTIKF
jgi:hypothetical protein